MTTAKQRLIKEIQLSLGGGIVDLEADPEHYEMAITRAIDRYRQRASNSLEESFLFLDLQPEQAVYSLPQEVQIVRYAYRRGLGSSGGTAIDPFSLAFTNNLYMINNPGGMSTGGSGFLATYDLAMGFQELAGRMFGREVIFNWNPSNHRIQFHRKFGSVETILLHVYNMKPDEMIINDVNAKPWVRDYSIAHTMLMIGQARSKFSQIAGPQGGSSLNGDALIAEAKAEIERLDKELEMLIDNGGGQGGYGFTIG
jgi:hypothetical protein